MTVGRRISGAFSESFLTIAACVDRITKVDVVDAMVGGCDTSLDGFNDCIGCDRINLVFLETSASIELGQRCNGLRRAAELPAIVAAICEAHRLGTGR